MSKYITYGHILEKNKFTPAYHSEGSNYFGKPGGGLWCSPIDSKYGWKDWCKKEGYEVGSLRIKTEFDLSPEARILKISGPEDIPAHLTRTGFKGESVLDWDLIAKEYDAVWLTDVGAIRLRFDDVFPGFYGWDCESLVILRWDVIDIPDA